MGETGCLCIAFLFFAQPPLVSSLTLPLTIARFLDPFYTFSPPHCRLICDFTPLRFECIGIQFFHLHPCGWLTGHHPTPEVTHTHMWLTGRHATPEVTLHISRAEEDFRRGNRHFKHEPPPTYFICLSPKVLYW